MQFIAIVRGCPGICELSSKTLRVMQFTTVLLLGFCLQTAASGVSQTITYSGKDVPLEKVFTAIKQQTGYYVSYKTSQVRKSGYVTIHGENMPLVQFLNQVLKNQPLEYTIEATTIFIKWKKEISPHYVMQPISGTFSLPESVNLSGRVTNNNKEPLEGVSVVVKGTQNGTVTSADGRFLLTVASAKNVELIFSFVGFDSKTVKLGNQTVFNIILENSTSNLSDVVLVAYGKASKATLTSSVSAIKGDALTEAAVPNVANNLSGRIAGILTFQTSGEPGFDETTIRVRGQNTIGNSAPLVVIDGIPGRLTDVNPEDIEDMSVLKDAAAVAPYGLAAANGVILITTKQGVNEQKAKFSYTSNFGIQNPVWITKTINSYEQALMRNEIYRNDHPGDSKVPYNENELEEYRKVSVGDPSGNYDKYYNSRNVHDIIRQNYPLSNQTLSVRGGTKSVRYYGSLGYTFQASMIPNEKLKKYYGTVNLDIDVTKSLKLFINTKFDQANRIWPSYGGQIMNQFGIYGRMYEIPPNDPIWWPNTDGQWAKGSLDYNPIGRIYTSGKSSSNEINTQYTLGFEKRIIKGLSIKGTFNYRNQNQFGETWNQNMTYWDVDLTTTPATYIKRETQGKPKFTQDYFKSDNIIVQGFINYDNTFGQHRIQALILGELNSLSNKNLYASRQNYSLPIHTLNSGSSVQTDLGNGGSASDARQFGIVGKIDYGFRNKYLVGLSGRLDEHYYFAPGFRTGFFPALSLGWRISEEDFIKENLNWVNELKIRTSLGKAGNLAGAPFQYLSTYGVYDEAYMLGNKLGTGLNELSPANPKITWEIQDQFNLGLDLRLWKGKLTFSGDYFYQVRNNMLVNPDVILPGEYGIGLPQQNAGKMSNKGIELSLGTNQNFKNGISFQANANFTFARNKIIQIFENPATYNDPQRRRTGRQLGAQFGLIALGYFQSQDEIDKSPTQKLGYYTIGDLKYADLNGDGKVDVTDETMIGNPTFPECIFGINLAASWKGFDIGVLFQGATAVDIQKPGNMGGGMPAQSNSNTQIEGLDHWTPETPNAKFPRFSNLSRNNNYLPSNWYLRNGSYIRLKNFNIGYTIPQNMVNKILLESVRVYITGQNMLTWTTSYLNADPESASGGPYRFANQKALSVGINIIF